MPSRPSGTKSSITAAKNRFEGFEGFEPVDRLQYVAAEEKSSHVTGFSIDRMDAP